MRTTGQKGCLTTERRRGGAEVWIFRWRDKRPDGSLRPRKRVVGSLKSLRSESSAWERVRQLGLGARNSFPRPTNVAGLIKHFSEKELMDHAPEEDGRAHSTCRNYRGYLKKWIEPEFGEDAIEEIDAVTVEQWLREIRLEPSKKFPTGKAAARGTKKKIRDLMHQLFNHAIRYKWLDHNPISMVRQSGKREHQPAVLEVSELVALLQRLELRERILVFLDFGLGARRGELMGLRWNDIDFKGEKIFISRSIVNQHVGKVKTEASEKALPVSRSLLSDLNLWRQNTPYAKDTDYVFASPFKKGAQPYWLGRIMQYWIKPAAKRAGITKNISWHTLRHTYASLLQSHSEDPKVVQELLRHASISVTMNVYAQAVTDKKRAAQNSVVEMVAARRHELRTGS